MIKTCLNCGRQWTPEQWVGLKYVGVMDDGDGGLLELRNCVCTSTLAVPTCHKGPLQTPGSAKPFIP